MLRPAVRLMAGAMVLAAALAAAKPAARQTYQLGPAAGAVLIDFLAVDRAGQPVLDLRAPEIILKIDGRVRPVSSLKLIDFGEAWGESLTVSGETVPPPFGSNVIDATRLVVVLIDDDSIRPGRERATLAAVDELVASLPPRARVVIATPHGGWKTRLTADRTETRRALSQIAGRAFEADDVECRTRITLDAITSALAPFSSEAAPTILVVSGGLAGPRQSMAPGNQTLARATGVPQSRPCDLRIEEFLRVGEATARTRAHLYVIQPDDVTPGLNIGQSSVAPFDLTAGLGSLAGVAGGKLLHLTPASVNPLIAAERESSAYYLLAFEPTPGESTGSGHRIDVQVTRANIVVTRRPQVIIEKAVARVTGPEATTPVAMLRDPGTRRELPLRATGYASRNPDPASSMRIIVFAESIDPSVPFTSAAAGLFDPRGRLISQWTSAEGSRSSGPILAALTGPPGTYRLRVSAVDASGRAGTADYFVEGALAPAGPLTLSALMLGVLKNGTLTPTLQFTTEPAAVAFLEIYGERNGKPIAATLEMALDVNGPAILTLPLPIVATSEADRFAATASIPIDGLAVGDYIVRVTVNLQDRPQGRVVRTLRKR